MNRTLFFGEGLFETIKWQGENRKLKLHYERLKSSADFFSIPYPSYNEFLEIIKTAVSGGLNLYVKFCLFSKGSDYYADTPDSYEMKVVVKNLPSVPERVKLTVSSYRRHSENPIFRHKTMNYLFNVLVKREAKSKGFYDALVLNERDEITECSASNIILMKGDKLFTPARECGLLWGTTLELLSRNLYIKEEILTLEDLQQADAVFVVNSLLGIVPVESIDGTKKAVDRDFVKVAKRIIES